MVKVKFARKFNTESGETVGPMIRTWGGAGQKFSNGDNIEDPRVWATDGTCSHEGHAIIAEWTDSPAEVIGAISPNEYGRAPNHIEPSTRARILDTAKEYVTRDRQATHGAPEDTFSLIAAYWSAHLDQQITAVDVATMMALLKLARSKANPSNDDNFIDCAGYAACAGELAE